MLHSPSRSIVTIKELVPIETREDSHPTSTKSYVCWLSCFCSEFQQHMAVLLVPATENRQIRND